MSSQVVLRGAVLAVFALLATLSAPRAEEGVDTFGPFHVVAGAPGVLALEGPLPGGSAGAFLWALQTVGTPQVLRLNSDGGTVEDALAIADLVRVLRIETEIPPGHAVPRPAPLCSSPEWAARRTANWWDPLESTCRHASLSIL